MAIASMQMRDQILARMTSLKGSAVIIAMLVVFGTWVYYPLVQLLTMSFNTAQIGQPIVWSLENWRLAYSDPRIYVSLWNTFLVFGLYMSIGFPVSVLVAWVLARTNIPFSKNLEFSFWIAFMMPTIAITVGWTFLLDEYKGLLNVALVKWVPFIDEPIFNIYSLSGIVFVHLMSSVIPQGVMLLTPAFRNMDATMEEAGRTSGASSFRTALRVTLPLMTPAIVLVFMLKLVRMFQGFEIEQILGTNWGFYVYSTRMYHFLRHGEIPDYGPAAALGVMTVAIVFFIIPVQRWLTTRRLYTTVTGNYKPGVIDLGKARPFVFAAVVILVMMLSAIPVLTLLGGSFMTRVGFFEANPPLTLRHWWLITREPYFLDAVKTTLILATSTAIISPVLFSMVAYVLVRTRWRGRGAVDTVFWTSSAIPGMVSGLGLLALFLNTPGLLLLYGTIYALILVVILQGKLLATQMSKGVFLQLGGDIEEAARISGAGWLRTYITIWIPLLMPMLVMLGVFNFVLAANTTSSIILLSTREVLTLSILALEFMTDASGARLEEAGIISLTIAAISIGMAVVVRRFAGRMGLQRMERVARNPGIEASQTRMGVH